MLALQVTLMGGQEFPAKVLGYDEDRDVAVLQLVFGDGEPVSIDTLLILSVGLACILASSHKLSQHYLHVHNYCT